VVVEAVEEVLTPEEDVEDRPEDKGEAEAHRAHQRAINKKFSSSLHMGLDDNSKCRHTILLKKPL
jgi:hypothetical protein